MRLSRFQPRTGWQMARHTQTKREQQEDQELARKVEDFSGVARSVECFVQQGHNNFRIVTLTIKDGVVVKKEYSDPFASFEAIARLEVKCHEATLALNMGYKNGMAWKS